MDLLSQHLESEWDLVCARDRHGAIARRWANAEPELSTVASLEDILARCHNETDPATAHATFAALCRLADADDLARIAVLRALVPAICSISRRYRRYVGPAAYFASSNELAAYVASSMSVRLLRPRDLGPRPVRRLMGYASWSVRVAHQKHRADLTTLTSWEQPDEHIAVQGDIRTGPDLAAVAIRDGYRNGHLSPLNARILFRRTVLSDDIQDIAHDEGIHSTTVNRRHARALASAGRWAMVA